MSFEEEFDKIVRQKAEGAEFPFDEKNWEKARKMLDAERKVAGIGFSAKAYVMALLILCLGTAGYFVFNAFDAKDQGATIALNEKSETSESFTVSSNESKAAFNTLNENAIADKSTNAGESNKEATTSKAEDIAQKSVSKMESSKIVSAKTATKKQSSDLSSSTPVAESITSDSKKVAESGKSNYEPLISVNPSASFLAENKPAEESGMSGGTDRAGAMPENEITDTNESLKSENENMEMGTLVMVIPKSEPAAEPEITLMALNPLGYFDEDYYTKEKYKRQYLDLEAGGAYLLGWKANSETDGRGFNWYGGINYGFYITKKVSVSVGAQAYNISNIGKPFFNHTKTEFGFTSSSTQTMITAKSLYYAAIPLKVSYSFNSQSQIGVGCNIGLLMSSRNVMETNYYQSDVRTNKTSVNTKGFYDGMNTTNIQFSMFYKTKLSNRLHLNAEAMYAPSDIYRYAHSDINTSNSFGFRLGLQYTLLER